MSSLVPKAQMAFCLYSQPNSPPPLLIRVSPKYTTTPILINSSSRSLQLRAVAAESAMANSVRVAAAQMTSINDLAANFATCSRLVKNKTMSSLVPKAQMAFCLYSQPNSPPPLLIRVSPKYTTTPILINSSSRSLQLRAVAAESAMANSVRVAAAQMTSINDLAANFATCSRLVKEAAAAGAKMLCFPENFSYVGAKDGDSLKIAEPLDGTIMKGYCSLARESSIWLSLGGFQEKGFDDAHLRNTHVLIDDAGNIRSTYSKMFLFDVDVPGGTSYKESSFTEAGKKIVAVDSPVGRLGLTVCYDLRFPEIYHQLRFNHEAQVLLIPAAFTKVTGQAHWEILLRARAIETQCYVRNLNHLMLL
ncbi:hypothetical protein TEA_020233 [Camellia sinensis var. sinensis]|uniref:CN hydrolase domain-containing protein n=1 Tax=Camellia sinensis var. sinensis TaxID=542762 RepID=A0A4S4F1G8_CAMSN|nr:hypothetical protein TEA_020233 [Camellia sinensis var. sinensis]